MSSGQKKWAEEMEEKAWLEGGEKLRRLAKNRGCQLAMQIREARDNLESLCADDPPMTTRHRRSVEQTIEVLKELQA
jgi:hypothetical protein